MMQFDPRAFFATPENFLMLNYQTKSDGFISLHATKFDPVDEVPPYDSWFTDYDTSHIPRDGNHHGFCARSLMNRMAATNRRAAANILFVPNADEYDRYTNMNGMLTQERNGGWLEQVVVDYRLQPNELRAAFWSRWRRASCVDGGVQFTPEGFVMQPLYKGFFGRTFL